ncbi:hypothetical protein JXB11_02840 [Candidatus Woesearchaeota archaeon]|nr:hypothetical protein [Candidatus Woesearchaeota archaeon]
MKTFRDAVKEVRFSLRKLAAFEIIMNMFIVFLVFYLVLLIFGAKTLYALIPTLLYAAIFSIRRMRQSASSLVEERYSTLKEKFRTAVENQYKENPVVNELQAEVMRSLRKVEESSFFNNRETYIKSGVIVFLCFLIFFFSPISLAGIFQFDLSKIIPGDGSPGALLSDEEAYPGASTGGAEQAGEIFGDEEIYGKLSVAKLGEDELFVEFNPGGHEINLRDVKDVREVEFEETYPTEIAASSGEVLEENIPKEQQELVKNYFKQLVQEG